jgi:hypothetical protein
MGMDGERGGWWWSWVVGVQTAKRKKQNMARPPPKAPGHALGEALIPTINRLHDIFSTVRGAGARGFVLGALQGPRALAAAAAMRARHAALSAVLAARRSAGTHLSHCPHARPGAGWHTVCTRTAARAVRVNPCERGRPVHALSTSRSPTFLSSSLSLSPSHTTQVDLDLRVDLPQVAVVGAQSAGKSSVLESLVSVFFLCGGRKIRARPARCTRVRRPATTRPCGRGLPLKPPALSFSSHTHTHTHARSAATSCRAARTSAPAARSSCSWSGPGRPRTTMAAAGAAGAARPPLPPPRPTRRQSGRNSCTARASGSPTSRPSKRKSRRRPCVGPAPTPASRTCPSA